MLRRIVPALVAAASLLASASARADGCFPACREGFVCAKDRCVSACNPPCGNGLTCQNGDCAPTKGAEAPPPAAPPKAPPPAEPPKAPPPAAPAATPEPPPEAAPNTGGRLHNGFYLRLALGAGLARYSYESTGSADILQSRSESLSGTAVLTSFLLGGTLFPGFALGAGAENAIIPGLEGQTGDTSSVSSKALTFSVYGPFADYYFNPRKGLHAQLMLGVGVLGRASGEGSSDVGGGFAAGFGHDWWVSEEWSIGVLARLSYFRRGKTSEYPSVGGPPLTFESTQSLLVPGVLATFTYH